MNKKTFRFVLSLYCLFSATVGASAEITPLSLRYSSPLPKTELTSVLNLPNTSTLKSVISLPTQHHSHSVKMQQFFQGIPIYGHHIVVEENNQQQLMRINGDLVNNIHLTSLRPQLTQENVINILKEKVKLTKNGPVEIPKSQLYIYLLPPANQETLIYKVQFWDPVHQQRPTALIDANSGKIIKYWDSFATYQPKTTPDPLQSTRSTSALQVSQLNDIHSLIRLKREGIGGNSKTGKYPVPLNVIRFTSPSQFNHTDRCFMIDGIHNHHTYKDTDTHEYFFDCTKNSDLSYNGGYSPLNDVHYFSAVTTDMYSAYLQQKVLTIPLLSNVEYQDWENSSWNGKNTTYGGGDKTKTYPFTSLDIVAHEISHGYTEQHADLDYQDQSGAINEAYSDIAGQAAEYFLYGKNNFLSGGTITKPNALQDDGQPMDALRYMCNPPRDGKSIDNAQNYKAGMEVHFSSGVYNKAFCLLAKAPGWNTRSAFQTFARANALYWDQTTDFNHGACGMIFAAEDNDLSTKDVIQAFSQVGVSCPSSIPGQFNAVKSQYSTRQWPIDAGFPQTGFSGAQFALLLPATQQRITWHSSNEQIASVSQSGKVTLHQKGKAVITAVINGKTLPPYNIDVQKWFVIPQQNQSISVDQAKNLCQRSGLTLPTIEQLTHNPLYQTNQVKIGAFSDEWGQFPITITGGGFLLTSSNQNGKAVLLNYYLGDPMTPFASPEENYICSDSAN